jgi:hypothetical protein
MKILLAAASFATNISGVQRHALSLARCLLLRPEVSAVHLVVAPWQSDFTQIARLSDARLSTHIADISHSAISRNLWYYRRLPELAAQLQADIVHLSFPVPCNGPAFNCPTVVTLHDMYPYEIPMNFGFPKFIFNRIILQQCIRSVNAIACVSDATRNRLKQYAPASKLTSSWSSLGFAGPRAETSSVSSLAVASTARFTLSKVLLSLRCSGATGTVRRLSRHP